MRFRQELEPLVDKSRELALENAELCKEVKALWEWVASNQKWRDWKRRRLVESQLKKLDELYDFICDLYGLADDRLTEELAQLKSKLEKKNDTLEMELVESKLKMGSCIHCKNLSAASEDDSTPEKWISVGFPLFIQAGLHAVCFRGKHILGWRRKWNV